MAPLSFTGAPVSSTGGAQPAPRELERGRALATAFEEAERQPALAEARDLALDLAARGAPSSEVAAAMETDVGLTCAAVRAAGQVQGGRRRICSVPDAVERLGSGTVGTVLRSVPRYDLFNGGSAPAHSPDRLRLHSIMVQRSADRVAEMIGAEGRDELALAAILHDIGRPVLARLHPGYDERFDRRGGTPDDRIAAERRGLGIDHALVGGVLTRRWGVHPRIAEAIERHHDAEARGHAAIIRIADMITAHVEDSPMSLIALRDAAERCGLGAKGVREVLYELPQGKGSRPRPNGPCPLSARELDVLRQLAEGKVYKQIAQELNLSASTVRSHLHNVYGKLGALDRAQAVLIATEQGWI